MAFLSVTCDSNGRICDSHCFLLLILEASCDFESDFLAVLALLSLSRFVAKVHPIQGLVILFYLKDIIHCLTVFWHLCRGVTKRLISLWGD